MRRTHADRPSTIDASKDGFLILHLGSPLQRCPAVLDLISYCGQRSAFLSCVLTSFFAARLRFFYGFKFSFGNHAFISLVLQAPACPRNRSTYT